MLPYGMAERGKPMINNISEGALRTVIKIDPGGVIHDKEVSQQKAEEARQARPVEKSAASGQAETENAENGNSSKYVVDDNQLVFEKYDKNGDLILRIPPSYRPVSERA